MSDSIINLFYELVPDANFFQPIISQNFVFSFFKYTDHFNTNSLTFLKNSISFLYLIKIDIFSNYFMICNVCSFDARHGVKNDASYGIELGAIFTFSCVIFASFIDIEEFNINSQTFLSNSITITISIFSQIIYTIFFIIVFNICSFDNTHGVKNDAKHGIEHGIFLKFIVIFPPFMSDTIDEFNSNNQKSLNNFIYISTSSANIYTNYYLITILNVCSFDTKHDVKNNASFGFEHGALFSSIVIFPSFISDAISYIFSNFLQL